MNKIPTAEEFYLKTVFSEKVIPVLTEQTMIEFAKLHVAAALEAAANNTKVDMRHWSPWISTKRPYVNKESVINSYPLDNIK